MAVQIYQCRRGSPDWSVEKSSNPIGVVGASGNSLADLQYLGDGILKAVGVRSATISQVKKCNTSNPRSLLNNWQEELQMVAPPGLMHQPYPGGGTVVDAYCRLLVNDQFRNSFSPPKTHLPDLEESRNTLQSLLEGKQIDSMEGTLFIASAVYFGKGISFFTTTEGYIGLAPKGTRPDDQVVVLLGCPKPMLLRPNGGRYQVVGECYVYGLMQSEALLGVLPSRYQNVFTVNEERGGSYWAFLDLETGIKQYDDPKT